MTKFYSIRQSDKLLLWKTDDPQTDDGMSYDGGNDPDVLDNLVEKLNANRKAMVSEHEDGLYVCWGDHDRNDPCDWVKEISYTPEIECVHWPGGKTYVPGVLPTKRSGCKPPDTIRRKLWMDVCVAVAKSSNCRTKETPGNWANQALEDFDKAFTKN